MTNCTPLICQEPARAVQADSRATLDGKHTSYVLPVRLSVMWRVPAPPPGAGRCSIREGTRCSTSFCTPAITRHVPACLQQGRCRPYLCVQIEGGACQLQPRRARAPSQQTIRRASRLLTPRCQWLPVCMNVAFAGSIQAYSMQDPTFECVSEGHGRHKRPCPSVSVRVAWTSRD